MKSCRGGGISPPPRHVGVGRSVDVRYSPARLARLMGQARGEGRMMPTDQVDCPLVLRVDGVPVAEYVWRPDLPRTLSPRPYLHPVRTLAGTSVTELQPADHPHHLGVSVAVSDLGGAN